MSFKQQIIQVGPSHYVLAFGVAVPVDIYMSDKLLADSQENLWQEVACIAAFPGVRRVVVTADAHASGNGIPVGVVVETRTTIIPCAAGYDISCGMLAVFTNLAVDDVLDDAKVYRWIAAVEERVATGAGRHRAAKQRVISPRLFQEILRHGAHAIESDKKVLDNLERTHLPVDSENLLDIKSAHRGEGQLGSEGGGNHFIEIDIDQDGRIVILIHTGSRGYGHGTAEYFFLRGAEEQGLRRGDKEKCFFYADSILGRQYENHMNAAANFAIANRLVLYRAVEEATHEVFGGSCELYYEISHNLVQVEGDSYIHRKGATRAFPVGHPGLNAKWGATGHPILIPGSMGTASAILFAKEGAANSLYSINHGCGRVMGRREAKREYLPVQALVNEEMAKMRILTNTKDVPVDECLHVYKDIDEVLFAVEDAGLAEVKYKLRPRAVIKGVD